MSAEVCLFKFFYYVMKLVISWTFMNKLILLFVEKLIS